MAKRRRAAQKRRQYNFRVDGVSYSTLSSWLTCREQCRLRLQGWRPVARKEALEFGSLFHGMLQALYEHFRLTRVPKSKKKLIASAEEVILPWIESYVKVEAVKSSDAKYLEMLEGHAALCEEILPVYIDHWEDDFRERNWLDMESRFRVQHPFTNPRTDSLFVQNCCTLVGIRDGVYTKGRSNALWILETKTKSRIDSELASAVIVDAQNLFYMWATYLEAARMPIGVDYNVVRRPTIQRRGGESHRDYARRAAEDMRERADSYFVRYEVAFAKQDVLRFAQQLDIKLEEFARWHDNQEELTYRNEGSCITRWTCEFLDACSSGSMRGYIQR